MVKNSNKSKMPHIALLMMLKNEEKRLLVSLKSVIGIVKSLVIYDTGSTDNTIQILKDFSSENDIELRLKHGEFVNFCVSRNVSLDFADSFDDIDFLLLLDCNDELQGGENLLKIATQHLHTDFNSFLVCQHWWSGKYDKYFNTRFLRSKSEWRYKGSVHEYLANTNKERNEQVIKLPDNIILYQDRTQDDDKTSKRFTRDKILLLKDYKQNPTEPRTVFYLAQTCSCLHQYEEAFYYYKLRSELEGFQEEKFHGYLRTANLSQQLCHNWYDTLTYYMKAVEHSNRAEPLIRIAEHYNKQKNWILAFHFSQWACSLEYPKDAILFVNKHDYDYTRWHILGIVAYYCGKYEEGKNACLKAIEKGLNVELDKSNLKFYTDKLNEINDNKENINKKKFIENSVKELQKTSNMTTKQLEKLALNKWKNRNKK
jgi:glycosyltransferase involved in cell wall biosynthesis